MKNRIKAVRDFYKKSQAVFGAEIGISGSAVGKLETGVNSPSEQTLQLICSVYNVNYRWLKDGVTKDPGKVTEEDMFLSPVTDDDLVERVMFGENEFAKSVMREFAKLGDAQWRMLEKLVRGIVAGLPEEKEDENVESNT